MSTERDGAATGRPRATAARLPTMQDLAEHVGVSRQLVSLVLRGAPGPSADSRERILAAAQQLGYRPNASARLLRQQRTRLIGFMFQMRNPFQVRVAERLFVQAAEAGFGLVLGPATPERSADAVVAELLEERVEAIVAFNPDSASTTLIDAPDLVPIVWLGEWIDRQTVDNVHVDEVQGLRLAVEHLTGLGHSAITYIGGLDGRVGGDRADAYRAAMAGAGLADRVDVVPSRFSEEGGAAAARELLARAEQPTAIVCCSDQAAVGAMAVLAQAGVRVPEDVSVVGFDDSYLASISYLRLTSVHQDVEATVEATMRAVLDRLDGDDGPRRTVATPTSLVVRASTGPAPA